ncbi:hypothetical protein Tcan_08482 [Toxocara canis]|uniref:Uncharacterized protein n=1 Tax=Toxocara canis TaxID=6265 RepID=A0A0B2VUY3_TOXCA|nr:hypothetical protein Tcan_08482 [Toxocara canis]
MLWMALLAVTSVSAIDSHENDFDINNGCIQKVGLKDCTIFNRCCEFYCRNRNQQHFCISILGQIQQKHSHCACVSSVGPTKRRRLLRSVDLIIALISIFLVHYIMLGVIV